MPIRKTPLITGQYYHIFNRGVAKLPIFRDKYDYERMIKAIDYYRFTNNPISYSQFTEQTTSNQSEILSSLRKKAEYLVKIHTFALMPNHFHFILEQAQNNGIAHFISSLSDSHVRYFNIKYKRVGPLFQGRFKSKLIDSEVQLFHLSRYIHLDLHTNNILATLEETKKSQYSSLKDYLSENPRDFIDRTVVLTHFKNSKRYQQFVFSHANYQKRLGIIKHLIIE